MRFYPKMKAMENNDSSDNYQYYPTLKNKYGPGLRANKWRDPAIPASGFGYVLR